MSAESSMSAESIVGVPGDRELALLVVLGCRRAVLGRIGLIDAVHGSLGIDNHATS